MEQIVNLKCPIHRREQVVTSCTNPNCTKMPLICPLCPDVHNDHYSNIVPVSEWIQRIAKSAQEGQKLQKSIRETIQIDQVLKWCEDDEMHLRKVEEHCRAQKALIQEDINFVRDLFNEKCIQIQISMEQELEDFVTRYKETFKSCKQSVDESYNLYKICSAFANSHNLVMKLQQSTSREAQDLSNFVRKLLRKDVDPLEQIRGSADKITEMTYNLPVYSFQEGIEQVCNQISDQFGAHLRSKLNIQKPKRPVSPIKYVSRNLHKQYSLPQENLKSPRVQPNPSSPSIGLQILNKSIIGSINDLLLKPLKKYQLDFAVSSIEVVTQQVFALTCSSDPHLRVFDTNQKRIHTLSAHNTPIIQMQKSTDAIAPLQPCNGQKPSNYLFTLSSDSYIVWTFDFNSPQVTPHIYQKLPLQSSQILTYSCYLQDNSCSVLGDKDGGIEVYNFQQQKTQQQSIKGKHSRQISNIILLKSKDKFAVGSYDQTISIWKLIYQQQFESTYCESIINCGSQLGQIQTMNMLNQNNNLLLVGTLDGSLKVVNLSNQCVVMESESSRNQQAIVDLILAEDPNKESVCAISLPQASKQLRMWKLSRSDQGWIQSESRMDIALSISENMTRSKLQLVQMPQTSANPLVLISNEVNKELLVYEILNK